MENLVGYPIGEKAPEEVNAIIEIPKLSRNKYEYDPKTDTFRLDRVLSSPLIYTAEYGFVPQTLAGDGDPADILVLMEEPTFPGCVIRARPLGMLLMADEKGEDTKILAVPVRDRRYEGIERLCDLAPHTLKEIEHFFTAYKVLDGGYPAIAGWLEREQACHYLAQSHQTYQASHSST
ncbi:MAG: inorganic diphosphatase [Bacteroidota bacterium]